MKAVGRWLPARRRSTCGGAVAPPAVGGLHPEHRIALLARPLQITLRNPTRDRVRWQFDRRRHDKPGFRRDQIDDRVGLADKAIPGRMQMPLVESTVPTGG